MSDEPQAIETNEPAYLQPQEIDEMPKQPASEFFDNISEGIDEVPSDVPETNFGDIPLRRRVKLRRAMFSFVRMLRLENPNINEDDFEQLVESEVNKEFGGYGVDPAVLALLIKLAIELAPLLWELFRKRN